VRDAAPRPGGRNPRPGGPCARLPVRDRSTRPRISGVTGMAMAFRTSRKSPLSTSGRSRSRPEPPLHLTTLLTGQPRVDIEGRRNPGLAHARGHPPSPPDRAPNSCAGNYGWMLLGPEFQVVKGPPWACAQRWMAFTPCELVNSVISSPHPPRSRIRSGGTRVSGDTRQWAPRTVAGEDGYAADRQACENGLHPLT